MSNSTLALILMLVIVVPLALLGIGPSPNKAMQTYWARRCTGIHWRRRFPAASKQEIREFLDCFVHGFAFPQKRRLCFSPDDKVLDVYRTLYPKPGWGDSLEIETFAIALERKYGLDMDHLPRREYTLGELFALTHSQTI